MNFKSKLEQAIRLLSIRYLTPHNNSILLVEYPKSGGTWLGQLVSDCMSLPFPRNRMPGLQRALYHGHYLPSPRILKNKKIIFLVRDGRDVMISLYFHRLVYNDKNRRFDRKEVKYHREKLEFKNIKDIKQNIGDFMRFSFEHKPSKLHHFTFMGNWSNYNKSWLSAMQEHDNIHMVRYEDLLHDTQGTVTKLLEKLDCKDINTDTVAEVVEKYSFENQTQRKKGQQDTKSFLRKGIKGDWKNYFGEEEKMIFKSYTGNLLERLGYEDDSNW